MSRKNNISFIQQIISGNLKQLGVNFNITEADPGQFATVRIYGIMKFLVKQYCVESLGNLSVMTMGLGPMQMLSFVLTPFQRNMPLLSEDIICFGDSRKCYFETFGLVSDPSDADYTTALSGLREAVSNYEDMPSLTPTPAWYEPLLAVTSYKAVSSADDCRVADLAADITRAFSAAAASMPVLSHQAQVEKLELTRDYCRKLVELGGVSTAVFKKAMGAERTLDFFGKVFFGTDTVS